MTGSIDLHIGSVIRARRRALGMSQAELARRIGCPPRQIRKYENGVNRVEPAMMFMMAKALSMPLTEFFAAIRFAGQS